MIWKDINCIKSLKTTAKRPLAPTTYHDDPALLQEVATLIKKVAEQEKVTLLKLPQSTAGARPPTADAPALPRPVVAEKPWGTERNGSCQTIRNESKGHRMTKHGGRRKGHGEDSDEQGDLETMEHGEVHVVGLR